MLTLVDTAEEATLVLRVQGRETDRHVSTGKTGAILGGKRTDNGVRLHVTLEYEGTSAALSAEETGAEGFGVWKRAAGKVAKQVEAWVKDNRATLAKR